MAPRRPASRWRRRVAVTATVASVLTVAACGSAPQQARVITWAVGPDRLDAAALAEACTDQAAGAYRIEVEQLPNDVAERHALLVRRLLAKDDAIGVLSLDSSFTTEFASAGFLAPIPSARVAAYSEGIAPPALAAATVDGTLAVAPWFFDPQVLWFRGNTAERAGLDTTRPISWDDLVAGAQRLGVTVEIEDRDGSGLSQWVDALVAGSGGRLVSGAGRSATVGLDTDAGRAAASIVEFYHQSGVGPGPSPKALARFAGPSGGFLVASTSAIADPALAAVQADMRAASYPATADASVAPMAGVGLAVPAHARDRAQAFSAIDCLTSPTSLQTLMTGPQHSASRLATYQDPAVTTAFRSAEVALMGLATGVSAPQTPFWANVVDALDETWRPIAAVTQDETPEASQAEVQAAIEGTVR